MIEAASKRMLSHDRFCNKWCLNTLHFDFVSKSLPLLLDWFFADVASKDYSRLQCTLLNIANLKHHSVLLLWFFVAPLVLFSMVEMWQGFLVNVTEFPRLWDYRYIWCDDQVETSMFCTDWSINHVIIQWGGMKTTHGNLTYESVCFLSHYNFCWRY